MENNLGSRFIAVLVINANFMDGWNKRHGYLFKRQQSAIPLLNAREKERENEG